MTLFGASHLSVLLLWLTALLVLIRVARRASVPVKRGTAWLLAGILVAAKVTTFVRSWALGYLDLTNILPMHLCDWATACVVVALLSGHRLSCELGFFWGLAGTFQGVLTPDLHFDFPSPEFFLFFISHAGVVLAAVYAVMLHRTPLTWNSVGRALLWLQVYALCALATNVLTGANYGYLTRKPSRPSLLDHLGPWPFYLLALQLVAVVLFTLLLGLAIAFRQSEKSRNHD